MRRKYIFVTAASLVLVAGMVFLKLRTTPWIENLSPLPTYPAIQPDVQPILVQAVQLPMIPGLQSPKPVVAADSEGRVVVVAHGISVGPLLNVEPSVLPGGIDILAWRSVDRGLTWEPAKNLTNRAIHGEIRFDPWLETDGREHLWQHGVNDHL